MSDGLSCKGCGLALDDAGVCGNCVSVVQDVVESSDSKTTPPLVQYGTTKNEMCSEADALIQELTEQHHKLHEETKMAIASLKLLLEKKEVSLLACYKAAFDYKVDILNNYKERALSCPPKDKSPLPSLSGGSHCGFIPEVTNLVHSTASLILEHRGEVGEGEEMRVSVIGSLVKDGRFWVRILPDDVGVQDVMLQNLSNTIGVELSMSTLASLKSANVGDLCCALYSEDQRWYRARVVEVLPKELKAKVYFLDYGNTETISYSNLSQLHPKFLVYPFQMIQCCLSTEDSLTFDREVKWKFTDLTHGSDLKVKVLQRLHDDINGRLHLVQLTNITGVESFDVGKTILVMAGLGPSQPNPIKYRDIRYTHTTPPTTNVTPPTAQTTPPATHDTPPTSHTTPPSSGKPSTASASLTDIQSQHSEATPTITIETPPGKEEPVETTQQPTEQLTPTQSCDSGLPSQSPNEESVSSLAHSVSGISNSSYSSNAVVTSSSSQDLDKSPATVAEGSEEVGAVSSKEEPGVQSPTLAEDVEGGVEFGTGNDVIESAAQIKVNQSAESAAAESGSHSPIPPAQSGSHSPIPVSVTGHQKSMSLSTEDKSLPCEDVPASECSLELKQGDTVVVYITTPLSPSGSFSVQLASAEEAEFRDMVELLQKRCHEEPPTPVFFRPGDICAAQFSDDSCWYRAKVEGIAMDKFLIRYLDFGNSESREHHFLMALRSEFRIIPFQAFQCSIAYQDHTSFSDMEIECFERLTTSQKLTAKIVAEKEDGMFGVELMLMLPSGPVELNEEVYTADVKITESISFTLNQGKEEEEGSKSSQEPSLPGPLPALPVKDGVAMQPSWADFMDDIQSPHNDGVFTLAGQDSRDHTPTPASLRPSPPPHRSSPFPRLASPAPQRSSPTPHLTSPTPRRTSPTHRHSSPTPRHSSPAPQSHRSTPPPPRPQNHTQNHTPLSQDAQDRGVVPKNNSQRIRVPNSNGPQSSSGSRSTSAPRIQMDALGMVRKNLLIAEKSWERKERAKSDQPQAAAKSGPDTSLPPGLPQPKGIHSINQVSRNGTCFPPTGRRRKSPEPEHSQIMDREGGLRAIEGLNGSHLAGSPKPLTVQPYKVSSVHSLEQQADFDSLPNANCTRLFVKNIPLNRTMEEVKGMFAQFGKVIGVVPVQSRKNVVYMYMDPEGAKVAIDQLYGKAVAKHSKPLIVEVSQPPRKNHSRS